MFNRGYVKTGGFRKAWSSKLYGLVLDGHKRCSLCLNDFTYLFCSQMHHSVHVTEGQLWCCVLTLYGLVWAAACRKSINIGTHWWEKNKDSFFLTTMYKSFTEIPKRRNDCLFDCRWWPNGVWHFNRRQHGGERHCLSRSVICTAAQHRWRQNLRPLRVISTDVGSEGLLCSST